jgi:hypothetical protein
VLGLPGGGTSQGRQLERLLLRLLLLLLLKLLLLQQLLHSRHHALQRSRRVGDCTRLLFRLLVVRHCLRPRHG